MNYYQKAVMLLLLWLQIETPATQTLKKNWNITSNSTDWGSIFKDKPVVGCKRLPDLTGTVVTHSLPPLRSEFESWSNCMRKKLVVACCWSAVYGAEL